MRNFKKILPLLLLSCSLAFAQEPETNLDTDNLTYLSPNQARKYELAEIKVTGAKKYDAQILANMLGFQAGDVVEVPGYYISTIIDKLWNLGLFADVQVVAEKIEDGRIWLNVVVNERPSMTDLKLVGVKRRDNKDLLEKINRKSGDQVNDNMKNDIGHVIKKFYNSKGFLGTTVDMVEREDTSAVDRVHLIAQTQLGPRTKIKKIEFRGNTQFLDRRLRRTFKKTHQISPNFFNSFRFVQSKFDEDKVKLTEFYQKKGYRDFTIVSDTLELMKKRTSNRVRLAVTVEEGPRYFLRNITWVGNTVYETDYLNQILKIDKGTVYDIVGINKRLYSDDDAVSNVYLDNGYLFSAIDPIEMKVEGDSIDLELRVTEGPQATVSNVIIQGNNKTNERVVRRELFVKPGDLFSKSKIIRDVRQIAQLGFFDETKINPTPIPDAENGTVDILYQLEEKGSDQLELSAGWGSGMMIGRVGLKFNNFSLRKAKEFKNWRPIPTGDGQQLSLSWQTNGRRYSGWQISFVEPWLGGYKPNSLSVTLFHSSMGEYDNISDYWNWSAKPTQYFRSTGITVGLGTRFQWPDDYFMGATNVTYQRYKVKDWESNSIYRFPFSNGVSHNVNIGFTIQRNSVNGTMFPTAGSMFSLSVNFTPPWSSLNGKDMRTAKDEEKYKWIEYHKWEFKAQWYKSVIGKLVLAANYNIGFLGYYNKDIGYSPYEGYVLGGSGMQSYRMFGQDIISLRGYKDYAFYDPKYPDRSAAPTYIKGNFELRYPITTKQASTIYAIAFAEGGNAWYDARDINPIDFKRALGVGIRAFLPMFGLLGIDWGYGLDPVPAGSGYGGSQFQFTLGQQLF